MWYIQEVYCTIHILGKFLIFTLSVRACTIHILLDSKRSAKHWFCNDLFFFFFLMYVCVPTLFEVEEVMNKRFRLKSI